MANLCDVNIFSQDGLELGVCIAASLCVGKRYNKNSDEEIYKYLLRLLKRGHLSPFEFAGITFRIRCPIYVKNHIIRYRTGSYMERSLRYCKPEELIYDEDPRIQEFAKEAFKEYNRLVESGVKKEKARAVLPLATQTELLMKINLRNLFHVFDERLQPVAQQETRELVDEMKRQTGLIFPLAVKAYDALQEQKNDKN